MRFLLLTGMSGAGKTAATRYLEDMGAFCVDNLPPMMILKFMEACQSTAMHCPLVAFAVDVRSGEFFDAKAVCKLIAETRQLGYQIETLFMEAGEDVLVSRYKETRRRHPLLDECDGCLEDAIREERRLLKPIRDAADYIIDTTSLSPSQLRGRIVTIFEGETTPMLISCQSFGFRNGLPQDADLVFDVRCLPNPYYVPELKEHDGTEGPVRDYVMNAPESHEMLQKLEELLAFSIPLYQREGKSQLVVAVGCTGGRHRSVAIACQLAAYLRSLGYRVELSHRDKDNRR